MAQKLQIQDRLSWNDGRRGGLEHRTINEFGVWLCARASAYQNAYSIAADQYQKPSQSSLSPQQRQHHPLLHNEAAHRDARINHAVITKTELIAFGVIQLDAVASDGELVPMTVLIDPGNNSTLFREGAIRALKLHGNRQTLRINGVADSLTTFQSINVLKPLSKITLILNLDGIDPPLNRDSLQCFQSWVVSNLRLS